MQHPAGAIQVVHEGLRHVVAGEPMKVVLVAGLELDFGKTGRARIQHVGRAQEVLLDGDDFADGSVVDALDGFAVAGVVAALQARHDREPFLTSRLARFADHLDAGRVDGVRLFDEHVLAGLDRGLHMQRVELGGVGNQHDVAALDDLLVSVETGETVVVIHRHLFGLPLFQFAELLLYPLHQHVAHCDQANTAIGGRRIQDGFISPPSATDQADADRVTSGDVIRPGDTCSGQSGG